MSDDHTNPAPPTALRINESPIFRHPGVRLFTEEFCSNTFSRIHYCFDDAS
jgi:hypothetical protein